MLLMVMVIGTRSLRCGPKKGEQRRRQLVGVDQCRAEPPGDLAQPAVGGRGVLQGLQLDDLVGYPTLAEDLGQRPVRRGDHDVVAAVGRPTREVNGVHLAAAEIELVNGDQQS